jgi:hypothetical protein
MKEYFINPVTRKVEVREKQSVLGAKQTRRDALIGAMTASEKEQFTSKRRRSRTKKAEPPPNYGVNRDSGTDRANGGWLRRLVRHSDIKSN